MGTQRNASDKVFNSIRSMKVYEWKNVDILPSGIKIIEKIEGSHASNPTFSHSSKIYAVAHSQLHTISQFVFYNDENKMAKEINWAHDHPPYKKGEVHVHYDENNRRLVRKPNKEELKLYEQAMEYNKKFEIRE